MATNKVQQEEVVFNQLDGDQCAFCETGTLVGGTYKGDTAVLCDSCEMPAYRSI